MGTVVVALQGTAQDDAALVREAAAIVRRIGGHVVAVRVVPMDGPRLLAAQDDPRLAGAIRTAREARVTIEVELLADRDPARAIADASRRHDADIVLIQPRSTRLVSRARGRRLARRIRKLSHALAFSIGGGKGVA